MRALLAAVFVFLAGCAGQYSPDPRIAEIQQWSEACARMGQAIKTATLLGRAGTLTEAEAQVIDKIDIIYRPVCTQDPGPIRDVLQDAVVRAAVDELCPGLTLMIGQEVALTAAQVATCVARVQLVKQLQVES